MYELSHMHCDAWHAAAEHEHDSSNVYIVQVRVSLGSSDQLSDSDIVADTRAEFSRSSPIHLMGKTAAPKAAKQPASASAGYGLTAAAPNRPQDKSLKALAQAAAAAAARDSPHGKQPAALQQLRALAGSPATSPAGHVQLDKDAAQKLTELADVPLTSWQSPAALPAGHAACAAANSASGQSHGVADQGSPASSWGGISPPRPITLNINVLEGHDGRGLREAGSLSSPGQHQNLVDRAAISHVGSGGHEHQLHGLAVHHNKPADNSASVQSHKKPVAASDSDTDVHRQMPQSGDGTEKQLLVPSAAVKSQTAGAAVKLRADLYGMHCSGADELAAAIAGTAGSPWDPQQGPKLLESLSDFSSFNSSLNMLQQLAGKSFDVGCCRLASFLLYTPLLHACPHEKGWGLASMQGCAQLEQIGWC